MFFDVESDRLKAIGVWFLAREGDTLCVERDGGARLCCGDSDVLRWEGTAENGEGTRDPNIGCPTAVALFVSAADVVVTFNGVSECVVPPVCIGAVV